MGFFKWLDKKMRDSNARSREKDEWKAERNRIWKQELEERERKEREKESERKSNIMCCANCRYSGYYGRYGCRNSNHGTTSNYKDVCSEFEWVRYREDGERETEL